VTDPLRPDGGERSGVTVIVVTYRHERFVDQLLRSIQAQTTPPQRVVLCDDASPDGSAERMRAWAATTSFDTVLRLAERNKGLTATLNAALADVETPYYAYISGDDLMREDRLESQLAVLGARPDLAFVYSDARVVDDEGTLVAPSFVNRFLPLGARDSFDELLRGNWIPAPSVLVRTEAAREVGGYDESLFLEDHDLWLRLASRFPFSHVDDALVSWRELSTSLGSQRFHDQDTEWGLTRIRIRAKHWGRDDATDAVVTDAVRPLLIALARRGVPARTLAPYLREVARTDRRATSRAYALVSATGSTTALRLLARARLPRRGTHG
jgi:glycosyltransferase involved in cell wall biosynthesis